MYFNYKSLTLSLSLSLSPLSLSPSRSAAQVYACRLCRCHVLRGFALFVCCIIIVFIVISFFIIRIFIIIIIIIIIHQHPKAIGSGRAIPIVRLIRPAWFCYHARIAMNDISFGVQGCGVWGFWCNHILKHHIPELPPSGHSNPGCVLRPWCTRFEQSRSPDGWPPLGSSYRCLQRSTIQCTISGFQGSFRMSYIYIEKPGLSVKP